MTSAEFLKLYTKQDTDDSVMSFTNEVGFSLVRNYPKDTPYQKDARKMFIKIAILNDGRFFYSVDMTKPEQREGQQIGYIVSEGIEYKKKITNFFSDTQEPFTFDEYEERVIFKPKNKSYTLNEFVDILAFNHLSDRLFFKRIFNTCVETILVLIFWLSDKHYEKIRVSIDKYHLGRDNKPPKEDEKNIEPFFKYFYISKNTIFASLLLTFLLAIIAVLFQNVVCLKNIWPFGEFSLSNPFVILFIFLILFSCEKFSVWLNKRIKEFFENDSFSFKKKKINFIERLHNYQYQNRFKLKLK